MAFNAKNLHYDKREPAFLRKLKGEFGDLDGRHNVQIARPKKDRLKTGDDDEDEPVIVDEQGERIEKAEFERRVNGEDDVEGKVLTEGVEGSKPEVEEGLKQRLAEIGSSANAKKRKVGKVVGGDENEKELAEKASKPVPEQLKESSKKKVDKVPPSGKNSAGPKKKIKKIKLSFDEPE